MVSVAGILDLPSAASKRTCAFSVPATNEDRPIKEGLCWPFTARIGRAPFYGARSASKKGPWLLSSLSPSILSIRDDMMGAVPQNEYLTHTFTRSP